MYLEPLGVRRIKLVASRTSTLSHVCDDRASIVGPVGFGIVTTVPEETHLRPWIDRCHNLGLLSIWTAIDGRVVGSLDR